jgi:hypothetical protein
MGGFLLAPSVGVEVVAGPTFEELTGALLAAPENVNNALLDLQFYQVLEGTA